MILGWIRRMRRRRLLAKPFPAEWEGVLSELPFFASLEESERSDLRKLVRILIEDAHWEGCGGLELTHEIRVTIAGQASLLLLGLHPDGFKHVKTILVYPSAVAVATASGGIESSVPAVGAAMLRGPLMLAWDDALRGIQDRGDGRNTVLHEFAHKLDMLDGFVDGIPPVGGGERFAQWQRVVEAEFAEHSREVDKGGNGLLGCYAATSPAEFFAGATEFFFERPHDLRREHFELFELLKSFYRQDPSSRAPGRTTSDDRL